MLWVVSYSFIHLAAFHLVHFVALVQLEMQQEQTWDMYLDVGSWSHLIMKRVPHIHFLVNCIRCFVYVFCIHYWGCFQRFEVWKHVKMYSAVGVYHVLYKKCACQAVIKTEVNININEHALALMLGSVFMSHAHHYMCIILFSIELHGWFIHGNSIIMNV